MSDQCPKLSSDMRHSESQTPSGSLKALGIRRRRAPGSLGINAGQGHEPRGGPGSQAAGKGTERLLVQPFLGAHAYPAHPPRPKPGLFAQLPKPRFLICQGQRAALLVQGLAHHQLLGVSLLSEALYSSRTWFPGLSFLRAGLKCIHFLTKAQCGLEVLVHIKDKEY